MDKEQLLWLFFGFNGRISRLVYFLAGLLLAVFQAFAMYQLVLTPEGSNASQVWSMIFWAVFLVSLWSHLALSAKRFHDFGKPGIFAASLFIPIVSILVFVALCFYPGDDEANEYGKATNTPQ